MSRVSVFVGAVRVCPCLGVVKGLPGYWLWWVVIEWCFVVLLWLGRVGRLGSVFGSCVRAVGVVGLCVFVVSVACVISHVSMLMSGACPSIWHLSVSDRTGAAVARWWNPMRCSLIVALGSANVFL